MCANELKALIETLIVGIGANTCLYYNFNGNASIELSEIWQHRIAQISLTHQPSAPLHEHFYSTILSVVQLNSAPLEEQLNNFKFAMQLWHSRDVLFLAMKIGNNVSSSLSAPTAYSLFAWCWRNGFYNVLLTDAQANELLTYAPFPTVRLRHTSLSAYLAKRDSWSNFHGYSIRVILGTQPPRALVYKDARGMQRISGLLPLIIKLFAERYNATLHFTVHPNPNYDFMQCIPEVLAGVYDICADNGYYSTYGKPHSKPLYLVTAYFAVRFPQPLAKFRYFLSPFQASTWCVLVAAIAYVTLLLALINWREHGYWNVGQYLLDVISSFILSTVHPNLFESHRGKFIFILLTIVGFIVAEYYLAFLSSLLSTDLYECPINTVEQLIANNISILSVYAYQSIVDKYLEYPELMSHVKYLPNGVVKLHRDQLDPSYAYINVFDIWQLLFYQQKFLLRPRLKLLEKPLTTHLSGMPLPHYWPFEKIFHRHVQQLFEFGFHHYFMQVTIEDAVKAGFLTLFKTEWHEAVALNLSDFEMPAILLIAGYLIAFVVFVIEVIWHKILKKCE
ncbi:uncharacterized protein LOC118745277 [Rhagoletis pomonella]|uniref:uncharacterized protein LOC118745277 n=1 Tax=Rhagoletis pomonella TaxID=28610 RepID=UPI00177BE335|nr:uncharacterized protein LOC118745277 [Rhagoletis pomonella]